MIELLAHFFVGKPLHITIVAVAFLFGHLMLRFSRKGAAHQTKALLAPAVCWGLYAAWELVVQIRTPEANIRVDLMLIWPFLLIVTVLSLLRVFRKVA